MKHTFCASLLALSLASCATQPTDTQKTVLAPSHPDEAKVPVASRKGPGGRAPRQKVDELLALLNKPQNRKLNKMSLKEVTKEVSRDHVFEIKNEKGFGQEYSVFLADANNDGKEDFLLAFENNGSSRYNGIVEAFTAKGETLQALGFEKALSAAGVKQAPAFLADPFISVVDGKTYLNFEEHDYQDTEGKNLGTSRATPGVAGEVREMKKFFWKGKALKLVNKEAKQTPAGPT